MLSACLGKRSWFSVLQKTVRKVLRIRENRSSKLAAFSVGAGAARRREQGEGGGGGFAEPQLPTSAGSSSPPRLLPFSTRLLAFLWVHERGREGERRGGNYDRMAKESLMTRPGQWTHGENTMGPGGVGDGTMKQEDGEPHPLSVARFHSL